MAPAPGVHIPLRYLRALVKKGAAILRTRLAHERSAGSRTIFSEKIHYEPAYAQLVTRQTAHPIHNRIKVGKRWYSTHFSSYLRGAAAEVGNSAARVGQEASRFPISKVGAAVSRITSTSPFASTLRPKLTGGALPRTASGYSLGNGGVTGARFFSHGGASSQAQVIAQVTAGVRAFLLNGKDEMEEMMKKKGRIGVRGGAWGTGNVEAKKKAYNAPKGAFVDFNIAPAITCLSTVSPSTTSLDTPGFMESLTSDFNTIMNDLKTTLTDIHKMKSTLGNLPISLVNHSSQAKLTLRIYFAGEDPDHVERLCQEAGIKRGVVGSLEDAFEAESGPSRNSHTTAFSTTNVWADAFELLMPTIIVPNRPSSTTPPIWDGVHNSVHVNWMDMLSTRSHTPATLSTLEYSPSEDGGSTYSGTSHIFEGDSVDVAHQASWSPGSGSGTESGGYDGLEGVHRFLQECEEYRTTRHPWSSRQMA